MQVEIYLHPLHGGLMKNLFIALNIWNEEQLLPECLDSIRKFNPEAKIVAVDGAYQSFADESKKMAAAHLEWRHPDVADLLEKFTIAQSTDKTLQILKDYKVDHIIECERDERGLPKPWAHEYTKRSKYFIGNEGDYYLVVDGDERLTKRLEWEKLTAESYNVIIQRDDPGSIPYPVMRIHRHFDGMHYNGTHHALFIGEQLWRKEMCEDLDFTLSHRIEYRAIRDPLRHLAKGAYYRWLTNVEESAFRATHRL